MNLYGNSQYLLIRKGPGQASRVIALGKFNIIGRGLESSISLLSLYISRVHCQLFLSDDHKWFVKDLGSLNGIFINDKLIDQSAVMEVHPGDFLGFGINCYHYLNNVGDVQSDVKYYVYQLVEFSQSIVDNICNGINSMQVEE